MEMALNEVVDRYSILLLKKERLPENPALLQECQRFEEELSQHDTHFVEEWVGKLKEVNGKIWDLESDIRKGKEGELGLEEVGKRAIAIRDFNSQRIALKNEIAASAGEFGDIKIDHASSA
jgi:hypothetical protein